MQGSSLISPLDAQNALEYMPEAFAFHEMVFDHDGHPIDYIFLAVNRVFETMTGLKGKDIIGRRVSSVIPKLDPFWVQTYGQVAMTGQPKVFENYDTQLKKWWEVSAFCPQPGRFAVFFRDISEEKQKSLENKIYLRLNEALYQLSRIEKPSDEELLSSALRVVLDLTQAREIVHHLHFFHNLKDQVDCYALDSKGQFGAVDCKGCEITDELQPGVHVVPSATHSRDLSDIRDWILVVSSDSDCFHAVVFKGVDIDRFGQGLEVFKTYFHEVKSILEQFHLSREKNTLQQQFLHAQKLKSLGVQAGIVAHDFNNLLAAILGKIELLRVRSPEGEELKTELSSLQKLVLQGKDLTTQLLSFVGMDSLEMREVELHSFARELEPLLRASISKNINLVFDTVQLPKPCYVRADSGRLRQALHNLVVNAGDAIGELTGEVRLQFGTRIVSDPQAWKGLFPMKVGEYASIEVADNGPGIPADVLEKIFEPFFSTKANGHGLGLSAVVNIIKEHRGNLRVQSRIGQGTSFQILLPQHEAVVPIQTQNPDEEPNSCQDQDKSLDVLLIDDEPRLLEVNRETFECLGHRVSVAQNGKEGLESYRQGRFDLVSLDLTMPGMSGQELWTQIKMENPNQKILILTGYSSQSLPAEMLRDENTRFLQKPFELRALTEKLQELLAP